MKKQMLYVVALSAVFGRFAYAHSELVGSVPGDDAVIDAMPKEVMLHFSEGVRLTALSVQKQGEPKQSLGPLPAAASEHFMVAAPTLGEGLYTVSWRALSDDTHVMAGEFTFAVGAAAGAKLEQSPHAAHADEHAHAEHAEHSGAH